MRWALAAANRRARGIQLPTGTGASTAVADMDAQRQAANNALLKK